MVEKNQDFPRAWVEFVDPEDDTNLYRCDLTWLTSRWTCIWGNGCKGIDKENPDVGCCNLGAHIADKEDLKNTKKYAAMLTPDIWQNHKEGHKNGMFEKDDDGAKKTRAYNGACIFHNPPGFEGGTGCAFHIAAVEAGERHMDWKPDVCWQVPIRLEEHIEDGGYVVSTIREWKRRDWGEGGDDFHWWCTESSDSFIGKDPTYTFFSDELTEIMGKKSYAILVKMLSAPVGVPLPHPALRKKD